jgi:hypothetical protein
MHELQVTKGMMVQPTCEQRRVLECCPQRAPPQRNDMLFFRERRCMRITQVQQVCNITSFCGVSLFDLANRHLVASPELARARAAVLEYLRTPSSDTDDDAVDFNIGAPPESQNPSPNPEP